MMNRRAFVGLPAAGFLLQAAGARSQDTGPARVGFIAAGSAADSASLLTELQPAFEAQGYRSPALKMDMRFAEGTLDRIPGFIADLEARGVALIVTHAFATARVVRAPRTVPVVYQFSADPVSIGIADSLSRPKFNATGITLLAEELNAKRVELVREVLPEVRRLHVLFNPVHPGENLERQWIDRQAAAMGMAVTYLPTPHQEALRQALARIATEAPQALLLISDGFVVESRAAILDLAAARGIPVFGGWAIFAESGAVFAYGPNLSEAYRRVAYFVDRVLRGAKPEDLPIERPNTIEFVVNNRAAQRLGLSLPVTLLARADRVID